MDVVNIAKICHQANKALCETIGDYTQNDWEGAQQWQRDSSISGVEFAVNNPISPASAQHDSWLADKVAAGWKYGPVKNVDIKEHPCIVPYDELPLNQRLKDHLFKAVVNVITLNS